MQIGGVKLSGADVEWLEREAREPGRSRTDLARRWCRRVNLVDALGRLRVVAARIELSRLSQAGRLSLPEVEGRAPPRRKSRIRPTCEVLPEPPTPPRTLADLGALRVVLVQGRNDPWHSEWTRSLDAHHYLGSGPLCGAQLRYVVCAGEEVLAAVSFSAPALQVAARDAFIGWSAGARRRNRHRVIAQSRFCLTVRVPHLASRVQGLLLERVAEDWHKAYGIRPVLVESYVDTSRFQGTCYRAANWISVGETAGRGRQDREHRAPVSAKSIWLYPLDRKWREALNVEPIQPLDPEASFAETEWGGVDLGDRRLTRRLVAYGRARAARPRASLPQACGSRAAIKAAYRLLNHPKASLESFLSGHRESTLARAQGQRVVLAIQDTTSLNYSTHPSTMGLGPISSSGANVTRGLELHSLLLSNLAGTPLGLLDVQAWARDPEQYGTSAKRRQRPTAEKESQKWLCGYAAADAAAQRLEGTQVVVVGDREADMFELLEAAVAGRAQLLVRASYPRRILTPNGQVEAYLWDYVRQEPIAGELVVQLPRRAQRVARTTRLLLRYREVDVRRPAKQAGKARSVRVFAIAATEADLPADGSDPIEWLLLTTLPIDSPESAAEKVHWYLLRWLIEVYHRTLKSGCRIEERHSTYADSLEAAIAVDVVVAWRVMALAKLGRETPEVPCTVFFEELEWKALHCFIYKTPKPPDTPPTLRVAMRQVAGLGGFQGRKCDGEPGTDAIWRGLERLSDISATAKVFFSSA